MSILAGFVLRNWRLKLAALGLSVFLWALVQTEPRNAENFSAVPIAVELSDTSWTLSGPPAPATLELRLSGSTREIIRLAREGTSVRVPVPAVGSADTTIALRREWVRLPEGSGLTVESVSPSSVDLAFEPALARVLPLALRTRGSLPHRLAFASPIGVTPTVVRVRGPASRIEALDSVRLQPLDLSTVDESGIVEVRVDTAGLGGSRVTPAVAALGVRVDEEVEWVVSGLRVVTESGDGQPPLSVEPDSVEVKLRGARTLVAAVDPRDLRAWIAADVVRDLPPGEARLVPVRVEGHPALVTATVVDEFVTVRRRASGEDGGADPS